MRESRGDRVAVTVVLLCCFHLLVHSLLHCDGDLEDVGYRAALLFGASSRFRRCCRGELTGGRVEREGRCGKEVNVRVYGRRGDRRVCREILSGLGLFVCCQSYALRRPCWREGKYRSGRVCGRVRRPDGATGRRPSLDLEA